MVLVPKNKTIRYSTSMPWESSILNLERVATEKRTFENDHVYMYLSINDSYGDKITQNA